MFLVFQRTLKWQFHRHHHLRLWQLTRYNIASTSEERTTLFVSFGAFRAIFFNFRDFKLWLVDLEMASRGVLRGTGLPNSNCRQSYELRYHTQTYNVNGDLDLWPFEGTGSRSVVLFAVNNMPPSFTNVWLSVHQYGASRVWTLCDFWPWHLTSGSQNITTNYTSHVEHV